MIRSHSARLSLGFVFTGASASADVVTTFDILSATVQKPTHVTVCFSES